MSVSFLNDNAELGPASEPGPPAASTKARRVPFERVKELGSPLVEKPWLFEVWLSGAEPGLAGLSEEDAAACGARLNPNADAFSFCVNGLTFTAIQSLQTPQCFDDLLFGRCSEDFLIERSGNHCDNAFPAVPLNCFFEAGQPASPRLAPEEENPRERQRRLLCERRLLSLQFRGLLVLCVGTHTSEGDFSCFISHFSQELLVEALLDFQRREIESQAQSPLGTASEPRSQARL